LRFLRPHKQANNVIAEFLHFRQRGFEQSVVFFDPSMGGFFIIQRGSFEGFDLVALAIGRNVASKRTNNSSCWQNHFSSARTLLVLREHIPLFVCAYQVGVFKN
jgi:hypothetical protein